MNLHEYQAKRLFADYGLDIPKGQLARSVDEAAAAAKELGGAVWVVKAQVHAGGRGKAGGVKVCKTIDEVRSAADGMLGNTLTTFQTGGVGMPINSVLVETGQDIASELYMSAVVDRANESIMFMVSASGGMNIEEVAEKTPEKIFTVHIDPAAGVQGFHARRLGFGLGLNKDQLKQFTKIVSGIYRLMVEKDAALIEINPLIITGAGDLLSLDAKINLDENALYRHPDLQELRDPSQEDEKEYQASQHGLNYIALDGDIGCMVNGAGLAMATMDLIQLHGGKPANFLDVGGGATAERVAEAFKLILSGGEVKAILVNIFGGIVRCDLIAEGILQAVDEVGLTIPVIARLEGTNVERGRELLAASDANVIPATDLTDAATKAVELAKAA